MKIFTPLALLAAALTVSGLQAADQGPWMIRAGVARMSPSNKSDAFYALGSYYQGGLLQTSQVTLPELALSYAFTPYLSLEGSRTFPQSQTLTMIGVGELGTYKEPSSCLLLQWHFVPGGLLNPYLGAGMHVTRFSSTGVALAGNPLTLSASSVGFALEVGLDMKVASHWLLNAQIKSLRVESDVNVAGAKLTAFNVNPILYSVGVGYTF